MAHTLRLGTWSWPALAVCLLPVLPVRAADATRAEPVDLTNAVRSVDEIGRVSLDPVDLEAVGKEDAQRERLGLAPRYAVPKPTLITPATHGTWETIRDDARVWRLRISAPLAVSLNLGFRHYSMPPGGRLLIYSVDRRTVLPPFTDADNESHGELWTPPIIADDIIVEAVVPLAEERHLQLELSSINYGYRGFGDLRSEKSGACNVDVVCPEGDPWEAEIQAVGVISTGGSTFCTGFMVNSTAQDLKPYFMTANHCGINSGNAASLVVFWNYQNSWCRPVGSPASGGPGDGSLSTFQTGSFFRSAYGPSDFTLVELDDPPNPAWNLSFAGWSRSSGESPSGVCIHHPNTDEKRITFYSIPTTTTSYNNPAVPGDGTHVHATWSLGVTEPGSSGSPLFDVNHRVIGQLHGGPSACGASDLSDYYGRFSISWNGGGTNSTRLSNWLDSGSTGAMAVDTISGGGMTVTPAGNVDHIGLAGGPFTNPSVTYTLTNPTPDPVNYQVSLTASFGILLDGGTAPVSGTLTASGGTVNVVVSLGLAINALPAGVYIEDVVFQDLTNALSHTRQHRVEIGQTLVSVTPAGGLESGGPIGGPFTGSIVYTVTSERPTPVSVQVAASDSWIAINGGAGPVTLNLSGTGDSDTVTIGYSAAANSLTPGIYTGTVNFTNLMGGGGGTSRPIALDVGRLVYVSSDVPKPINDNSTITSVVNVTDNYCIGDVNVDMDITHTYIGDLIVELRSPSNTTVRLHNRTGGTAENIVLTYDDEGTAPDGPGTLADFDTEPSAGVWTLTVSDNAGADTGTLNAWGLRIAPSGGGCPPLAADQTLVVSQGSPVDITLVASAPGGSGPMQYIIQSLPTRGTLSDPNGGAISSVPYTLLADGNVVHYEPSAAASVRAPGVIHSFPLDFDSFTFRADNGAASNIAEVTLAANPGWSVQGQWAFGKPTGGGSNGGDPTAAYTGNTVYGYNLSGDYANDMGTTQYLTTTALNCLYVENAELRFRRWLGVESATYDHASIQVSTNGTTWTTVWNHAGGSFNDLSWVAQAVDISALADRQPTVYIRWGMGPTDRSATYPGWNLDDIEIWGDDVTPTVQPPAAAPAPHDTLKNRYVSFAPNNDTLTVGFRVELTGGPGTPGALGYVGTPDAEGIARIVAAPVLRAWPEPAVHIGDCPIVPVASYAVSTTVDGLVFSAPLALSTIAQPAPKFWGDTVGDFAGVWSGPNGVVNVSDFVAALQKFQGLVSAPHLTWVDVHDQVPNEVANFTDIFYLVKAFQGDAYPFANPDLCP
ncbi:MAG: proprotein convertase P-domain-containing protein [Planctomycetes bacterium]|nr:proprotein convertase P-domain-containing protein [Planctomycetota bacterium]